jgi:hypothetical protein
MFIPLALGVVSSAIFAPLVNSHYLRLCEKHGPNPPPELRLIPMMCSCWFVPIGLFIFAWTSYPDVLWLGPAIGGFPVGFGFIFVYNSANNYLGTLPLLPPHVSPIFANRNSGFLPTPSRLCSGRQNICAQYLGCMRGAFHRTNVSHTRLRVGE